MGADPAAASAILEIDLGAICANWRLLAARVAPARCAAVVKANGYGLGAAPVATALAAAGCRLFFVATADEGIALRATLPPGLDVAILNGPMPGAAAEIAAHALIPVLNDPGQIAEWRQVAAARDCPPAMVQLDTGMARLGLSTSQFAELAETTHHPWPIRWHTLISHLACADEPQHPLNTIQRERFLAARARLPGLPASLAASSGSFLGPDYHFDLVRPGAALYGVNPQPGRPNPLRPVVQLRAKILQIREIDRGQPVGYGAAHVMSEPARVATVALGYADGWPRALSGRGCGRLGGKRVPLLGRVSMDLTTFDVSAVDPAFVRPGEFIELLGADYGIDEAARDGGTIGYEILTRLGARYHRRYRGLPSQ